MPRICTYNWHSRKVDGSPSVLHRFGRYWMILKAKTLVYTRKVMYGSLVESLCKTKIHGNDFCIPHHHQKYQNEKSFPGIYFFTGFQPSSCTLPCACRPTSEPSESSSIALKDAKLMENHIFFYCARFMCILPACAWLHFLSKKTPNESQDDWKMTIADCTCRAHVSNTHYEPPYALRRWVFATKCSYTAVFRCIYYRHVDGVFFIKSGKLMVLHQFCIF